jgi:hypothetical protein
VNFGARTTEFGVVVENIWSFEVPNSTGLFAKTQGFFAKMP